MRKLYILVICMLAIVSCDLDETRYHDVRLRVGQSYPLEYRSMDLDLPPDEFIASVYNGEIIGEHVGYTEIEASRGVTTHIYKIWVESDVNMYNDMSYMLRLNKNDISRLYGFPAESDRNVYFFYPLDKHSNEIRNVFEFDGYGSIISCSTTFDKIFDLDLVKHISDRYHCIGQNVCLDVYCDAYDLRYASVVIMYDFQTSPIVITYMTRANYERYSR